MASLVILTQVPDLNRFPTSRGTRGRREGGSIIPHFTPHVRSLGLAGTVLVVLGTAPGCDPGSEARQDSGPGPDAESLAPDVSPGEIRSGDGEVILSLEGLPGSIQVDAESEFQAADRFLAAEPSPTGDWLALVTTGVAHSAGWLFEVGANRIHPAAFQYGGAIEIGPWSQDGRWVVLFHEGPAGDRIIWVADRDGAGPTVHDTSAPVRTPDHDDMDPTDRIYEVEGWEDGILHFRLLGNGWTFDPMTGEVEPFQPVGPAQPVGQAQPHPAPSANSNRAREITSWSAAAGK